MSTILERMAESSRERAHIAKQRLSAAQLQRQVDALPLPPPLTFSPEGFELIAEIKPASPSEGRIAQRSFDAEGLAAQYVAGGAMALSVLTEPCRFGGSLELLAAVAGAAPHTPVMRKDFLVEPYQVLEARQHGAAGVLLIMGMTGDGNTEAMLDAALGLGMFALVEAFDGDQLERARRIVERLAAPRNQALLGLNCRDLHTLAVDPERFERFRPRKAGAYAMFAESGMEHARDVADRAMQGWDGVLVGTALMRSPNPAALIGEMLSQGRRGRALP